MSKSLESRIYAQQHTRIKRDCGADAADKANYGWGVIDDPNFIDVSTKVYGHGVLRSIGNRSNGQISHEWAS
jgi:hypothetical protein